MSGQTRHFIRSAASHLPVCWLISNKAPSRTLTMSLHWLALKQQWNRTFSATVSLIQVGASFLHHQVQPCWTWTQNHKAFTSQIPNGAFGEMSAKPSLEELKERLGQSFRQVSEWKIPPQAPCFLFIPNSTFNLHISWDIEKTRDALFSSLPSPSSLLTTGYNMFWANKRLQWGMKWNKSAGKQQRKCLCFYMHFRDCGPSFASS